jgi:uncharacterized protein YdhG (YjbR/CyaY superfamily)
MNKSNEKYKDINEYHAYQDPRHRELLEQLRQAIKQAAPLATETISYGMPAFRQNKILVYYAMNKNHIGFYPTPHPIAYFEKELEKYSTSKGAIQFPVDEPLPLDLIKKIVQFRVEEDANSLLMDVMPGVLHQVPEDIKKVLKADTNLLARWNKLTPIQRNEWICWVTIVKKEETRAEHIQRMIEDLKEGKRKPCCWPGCPHRKPSAQKWFKKAEI